MLTNLANNLPLIVKGIERDIIAFYGLQHAPVASDFLIERTVLEDALAYRKDLINERGGVYLIPGDQDEVFVGIYIGPSIQNILAHQDPQEKLSNYNLDAFFVLAEELSHFHLIMDRMHRGVDISKLELEWQGEVDKLLLSAITLRRQSGNPHYYHLARCLFEGATIAPENPDSGLYQEASHLAAKFWYDILSYRAGIADPEHSPTLKSILKPAYLLPWSLKVAQLGKISRSAA